mmetsp:Transcript_2638/g.10213  ORF Transcript_2638/g.10213 Transcript_2638/m.10213 type:complete len:293 (+) Transcript_2638:112-990(+)
MRFSELHKHTCGQWSPDGRYLAAASMGRVLVRDAETLKLVQVFVCCEKVGRIEWSPDSQYILAETSKQGVVQVWCISDGDWSCRIDEGLAGVTRARWDPSSRHVLIMTEFHMYLAVWKLQQDATAAHIRHPKYDDRGVAFNHGDGRFLAVLRRSNCQDHVSVHNSEDNFSSEVFAFQIDGDCADMMWAHDDSSLLLWDRPARASRFLWYSLRGELLVQVKECKLLRSAYPSPSAQFLVAACFDGSLCLLSGTTRSIVSTFAHDLKSALAETGGADDSEHCVDFRARLEERFG